MLDWIDHAGAVLGAGGSGIAGFVLNKFKSLEKDAETALDLVQTLKFEVDTLKRRFDSVADADPSDTISKADLAVESLQGQLEALRRELQSEQNRRQALEQEFRSYAQREVEKWMELMKDVAEIRGSLRETWTRR